MRKSIWSCCAVLLCALGISSTAPEAHGAIVISEYIYSGLSGEFVELTNSGLTAIDMTGWSYDDNAAGVVSSLSAFGVVAAGESVIFTEVDEALFRTSWNLSASVKVIGGITNNLGRADTINIFNASNVLVDSLIFGDNTAVGGPRAQNFSANPNDASVLGTNSITNWQLASIGDAYGSYASLEGDIANPGINNLTAVPEPGSLAILALGSLGLAGVRRLRKRSA